MKNTVLIGKAVFLLTATILIICLLFPTMPGNALSQLAAATNAVRVQAEDYDRYYDTSNNNVGMMYRFDNVDIEPSYDLSYDGNTFYPEYLYGNGYNNGFRVNSISNNEWLEYDVNIPVTDTWKFTFRMARLNANSASFDFQIDGQPVTGSPFTINSTGHHHIFQDIVIEHIALTAGEHVIKITFHGEEYDMAEFDWFYIESETDPPAPVTPVPHNYGPVPTPPQGYISPVSQYGRLQAQGVNLTSAVTGSPIQLRGVAPHGIQWFPTIDNYTIANYAYDVGAQITRIPMYVEQFGGYTFGPTAKDYMIAKTDEMIQDAIDAGIYVTVSFHVHVDPTPYTDEAIEFFTHVANTWGDQPNVIYEIVNESDGGSWAPIKVYADQIIPVIRNIETANNWEHNLIIVGTPQWCQRPDLVVANPINDVNVAYTFHWYAAGHDESLWQNIETVRNANMAVIVSEWGTGSWDWASPNIDLEKSGRFLDFLDERNISWINWAWNVKGEVLSSLNWTASMQGPWPAEDITASGEFVKGKINVAPPEPTPTPCIGCPTNTPTPTPDLGAALKVEYRAADTNVTDNQMKPHVRIDNSGNVNVALSDLTIRYWFTKEGSENMVYHCDYAAVNCSNVNGTVYPMANPVTGADHYLEITFDSGAGTLTAHSNTGEIQNRMNKVNWSNFDESDDYSFDAAKVNFTFWDRATLYHNGQLVWGNEPGGSIPSTNTPTAIPTNTPQGPTNTPTVTATATNTPVVPTTTPTAIATATNTPVVPTTTSTAIATATSSGSNSCSVSYVNSNDWGSGATIYLTITNNSAAPINGWTLTWDFPGNQQITNMWNASYTQTGASVIITNLSYNSNIPANGGTVSPGFNLSYSGSNNAPSNFELNGTPCQ
ncbi:MAG: cellulase family glycosylhydrolase [Anaerolineales bacterium]|nr:cellulase family glycosylhydrolase [Anaerolineales bacterium]